MVFVPVRLCQGLLWQHTLCETASRDCGMFPDLVDVLPAVESRMLNMTVRYKDVTPA